MNKIIPFFCFFVILLLQSCNYTKNVKAIGDQEISIFKHQKIAFNTKLDSIESDTNTRYFTNGRLVIKRVKLPHYERAVQVKAILNLQSAGDPWDKSGSVFIIPNNNANLLKVLEGQIELPSDSLLYEDLKGIAPIGRYKPSVELMRFMTPFGVGHYSNLQRYLPVYIPKWEQKVTWQQDVTQLISTLEDDVYIGVWIDTWSPKGYDIDLSLTFKESTGPSHGKQKTSCLPVINTVYYTGGKGYADIFSRKDVTTKVEIPYSVDNATLYYTVTGHGGHEKGDEFVQKENIISHNDKEIYRFIPWRDDCASFRRFNPSSGVWLKKDTANYIDTKLNKRASKVIEERIASSDLSRSNWCPGSQVEPIAIELGALTTGIHEFGFSIPKAQVKKEGEQNHWLVSAYLVLEHK